MKNIVIALIALNIFAAFIIYKKNNEIDYLKKDSVEMLAVIKSAGKTIDDSTNQYVESVIQAYRTGLEVGVMHCQRYGGDASDLSNVIQQDSLDYIEKMNRLIVR